VSDEQGVNGMKPLLESVERDAGAASEARAASEASRRSRVVDAARGAVIALVGIGAGTAIAVTGDAGEPPVAEASADPFGGALRTIVFEDEFNRLPVEERVALVRELLEKMRSMDSGSSAMLAAFAAGIKDEARAQLQENARKLMVDFMDLHATRYAGAGAAEREAMLEQSLRDMVELQRELLGQEADEDGIEEGLENAREQAEREQERAGENREMMSGGEAAGFMRWAQREGEAARDPNQRARVTLFMRDMTRHLRGQDLDTGKPK